jgi:iron complex transport system permease protein
VRKLGLPILLTTVVVAAVFASLRIGSLEVSSSKIARVLAFQAGLLTAERAGVSEEELIVIWHLRLPRLVVAAMVGASLALSGALLQGLFRNPMAGPEVTGVSSGGALGATMAIAAGLGNVSLWAVPLSAFGGAIAAAIVVYALSARRGDAPLASLVLCGLAVSSTAGALSSFVLSLSVQEWDLGRQILYWLMGGLSHRTWDHVAMLAPFLLIALAGSWRIARELDLLAAGEESAMGLGVDVLRLKRGILALAAASAGAAVAVSGIVSFVGLMVPHMARLVVGPSHRRLLPACAIGGATFLIMVDLVCRSMPKGEELRLGILTSGFGGPFFLLLVMRARRRGEGI